MTYNSLSRFPPVVMLALTVISCGRTKAVDAKANAASDIPVVAVAQTATGDLSQVLVLTGEFTPFQEIEVMAKVSGYVKQINVDIGDRVRPGQLLAVLEVPEMKDEEAKAKAGVERSQSQVTQAQDEVRRAESNHQMVHLTFERLSGVSKNRPGLVAQQEVDDVQSKDVSAEAQVQAAKSNLAAAVQQVDVSKAELGRLQTMYEYTKVTAPFAGVITKRFANTGSMIQAGTASQTQAMPLVRLSENSRLRLTLPVPESAVPTVHVGQQVDVRVPTLGRTFAGRVARSADSVQLSTRTMNTEVDVPNPGLILVPGMYAEVNLTLKSRTDALFVPVGSVDSGDASATVMLARADNHLERRTVTIGMETANRIEIRSGLRDGDLVVIGNRAALKPGQVVKPKITVMTVKDSK